MLIPGSEDRIHVCSPRVCFYSPWWGEWHFAREKRKSLTKRTEAKTRATEVMGSLAPLTYWPRLTFLASINFLTRCSLKFIPKGERLLGRVNFNLLKHLLQIFVTNIFFLWVWFSLFDLNQLVYVLQQNTCFPTIRVLGMTKRKYGSPLNRTICCMGVHIVHVHVCMWEVVRVKETYMYRWWSNQTWFRSFFYEAHKMLKQSLLCRFISFRKHEQFVYNLIVLFLVSIILRANTTLCLIPHYLLLATPHI